jgi:hypothetical protein
MQKNFSEIYDIIDVTKSEKIGEPTVYDTALRIGCYLNKFPEVVYLHSGTRIGAKNLPGNLNGKKY